MYLGLWKTYMRYFAITSEYIIPQNTLDVHCVALVD